MAVRRARVKPTANLSIKRPGQTSRPAILRAPIAVKAEKVEPPSDPVIKSENVLTPKLESKPSPPSVASPSPFIPPRPSPSPSPVLSPAAAAQQLSSRSPNPFYGRSPAHIPSRSPAHTPYSSHLDDALFKSPIMSPSYPPPPSRTPGHIAMKSMMSPDPRAEEIQKNNPGSPSKARHRIRPMPVLMQRRNSAQISEDEEIRIPQRVRHISTSSTASMPKFVPQQVGRIRTESSCSAFSDVSVFKPRRVSRSDEYMRLCEARRELLQKCNGEAPDKSQLKMYDMIYYNPKTNPMKRPLEDKEKEGTTARERRMSMASEVPLKQEVPKKEAEPEPEDDTVMPVPQLKLGENGEMILDEKSLTIETTGEKNARVALANADIVYDDSSAGFYKRQKRTKDWPPDETVRFYRCLQAIGTDFSLMLSLFPTRSRRDLKLKFKKEEKANGYLINKALIDYTSFDIEELKESFRKEDEVREEEAKELERLKEKAIEERAKVIKIIKKKGRRMSISEKAVEEYPGFDLESVEGSVRKNIRHMKKYTSRPALDEPFSVPPASPSKTPVWTGGDSPQKSGNGNEAFYYDMNLKCTTRGERRKTESDTEMHIINPKSVEMIQEAADFPIPFKAIGIKKEKDEDSKEKIKKTEVVAVEREDDPLAEVSNEEEEEDDDEEEEGGDMMDGLDLTNLVVLESVDANGRKSFKVHLLDSETDEMSEEPLDLPQEVIDYIVEAHQKNQQ